MKCTQCGTEVPDDSQFCTSCGAPLSKPAGPPETPPAPPGPAAPAPPPPPAQAAAPPPPPAQAAPPPPPGPAAQAPPPAAPPPLAPPPAAGPAPAVPAGKKSRKALWAVIGSLVALLVVAAVVIVLVVVVFGGGDTDEAKDLMNRADKIMADVAKVGDQVGEGVNDLFTNADSLASADAFEEAADAIRANTRKGRGELERAQSLYKEILGLDDVPKYKEYANAMLEVVDLDLEQIAEVDQYLDYISRQFALEASGQPVDTEAISARTAAFVEKLNQLSSEVEEAKDKAAKIKSDNDL